MQTARVEAGWVDKDPHSTGGWVDCTKEGAGGGGGNCCLVTVVGALHFCSTVLLALIGGGSLFYLFISFSAIEYLRMSSACHCVAFFHYSSLYTGL